MGRGLDMHFLGRKRRKIIAAVCKYQKTKAIISRFALRASLEPSAER
jgi:hypothetical protein